MPTKSLAAWCEGKADEEKTHYEVHVNYWRLRGDAASNLTKNKMPSDLLEVGVRIADITKVNVIRLWIPFKIARKDIRDCSEYFVNPRIAQGIFNDVLSVRSASSNGPRCVQLEEQLSKIFCRVHRFASDNNVIDASELDVAEEAGGTMLTITNSAVAIAIQDAADSPADTYFRLRIPTTEGDGLVTVLPPHDHALQSGYEVAEYIDFRLNEARTLPDSVDRKMGASDGAELRLVAFLTAVPILSNIAISRSQAHKMRILEKEVWDLYIPGTLPPHMMVYHWKRDVGAPSKTISGDEISALPIRDFSAFIKLSTRRSNSKTLLVYLGVAFLFGVFGNLAASAIGHFVPKGWAAIAGVASEQNDNTVQQGPQATEFPR